jgi:hypothetical protein
VEPCYSLESHLRTTAPGVGQVEADETYVGIDKRGVHYVLPVQAKGATERIGVVQIEQDLAVCAVRFPGLVCRPVSAHFMVGDLIALLELEPTEQGVRVSSERHYRLVSPDALSPGKLAIYGHRSPLFAGGSAPPHTPLGQNRCPKTKAGPQAGSPRLATPIGSLPMLVGLQRMPPRELVRQDCRLPLRLQQGRLYASPARRSVRA